jgi:cysteine desulfurase
MKQPNQPIYLDYSATTPVDPRVAAKMIPYLTEDFGNPASRSHAYGWTAEEAVEEAREEVAKLVNCDAKEIVWTSGATESINLALKGAAHFYQTKGKHIITVKTEHKATLDTVRELEREGFTATYLDVKDDGLIDLAALQAAIQPDTILVSVMSVNNEIGVIQPIAEIGEICRAKGIIFHVDSAQATGKIVIDLQALKVDLMSFSAHKTYGPKGMGALFVRRKPRIRLESQMHGGGHERGFRSGTLATHQIVGMGEAFRIARIEMATENERIRMLRDKLLNGVIVRLGMYFCVARAIVRATRARSQR